MDKIELAECMRLLCWSNLTLAREIDYNEKQVRRWLSGESDIPDDVARPLRKMADAHRDNPFPDRPVRRIKKVRIFA